MLKKGIAIAAVLLCGATGTAFAQQCLHGPNENADQAARRQEALTATRTVNNIQMNQPGAARGSFLSRADLAGSPYAQTLGESTSETVRRISLGPDEDILPGWKLILDVTRNGYWFMVKDKTDPCGFAYISNQAGVIFQSEPIR